MAMKYVGSGGYIQPIPMRDLTDEEEERYGETIEAYQALTGNVLYKTVAKPKATKAAKAAGGKS